MKNVFRRFETHQPFECELKKTQFL